MEIRGGLDLRRLLPGSVFLLAAGLTALCSPDFRDFISAPSWQRSGVSTFAAIGVAIGSLFGCYAVGFLISTVGAVIISIFVQRDRETAKAYAEALLGEPLPPTTRLDTRSLNGALDSIAHFGIGGDDPINAYYRRRLDVVYAGISSAIAMGSGSGFALWSLDLFRSAFDLHSYIILVSVSSLMATALTCHSAMAFFELRATQINMLRAIEDCERASNWRLCAARDVARADLIQYQAIAPAGRHPLMLSYCSAAAITMAMPIAALLLAGLISFHKSLIPPFGVLFTATLVTAFSAWAAYRFCEEAPLLQPPDRPAANSSAPKDRNLS